MNEDILSQEELDALLKGGIGQQEDLSEDKEPIEEDVGEEIEEPEEEKEQEDYSNLLDDFEKDAIGEIGNISMGTAATTLSTLLRKKVDITTPAVEITTLKSLEANYEEPLIIIDVSYKSGLKGSNILILKTSDAKVISDLMSGKEVVDFDREINDMDLSAVSEAMNQMMGTSATSLSEMLSTKIDILPPKSYEITFAEGREKIEIFKNKGPMIKISFRMVITDYIDSNIMQLIPISFGKETVEKVMGDYNITRDMDRDNYAEKINEGIEDRVEEPLVMDKTQKDKMDTKSHIDADVDTSSKIPYNDSISMDREIEAEAGERVHVKKPSFDSFDLTPDPKSNAKIDLVGDIPVEITVELGRTHKKIGDILGFGVGTVIELDKLVGEALNIYANGKYIARGEVVVIDDSFGIRVTEIDTENKKII